LPVGQAETVLKIFADEERILGGRHQRDSSLTRFDGLGYNFRRMAGHRAGVAEAQIHAVFSIGAGEVRAFVGTS
jgi:hypothetical protein